MSSRASHRAVRPLQRRPHRLRGSGVAASRKAVEMTARRGLKKIVRGRMARTGETYSTALRAVARPTIRHRESALVGFLLEDAGLDLSEPMVCGLGGGIGFMYAVFEYDAVPHPLLTIVMQHHPQPWAAAVFDRLGVPFEEGHSASPKTARAALL